MFEVQFYLRLGRFKCALFTNYAPYAIVQYPFFAHSFAPRHERERKSFLKYRQEDAAIRQRLNGKAALVT